MNAIYTLESKDGRTVKIFCDEDGGNPREWSNLGKIVYLRNASGNIYGDEKMELDLMRDIMENPDFVSLPVYCYQHSGVMLKATEGNPGYPFTCPWDSGQSGIVYVSRADIVKEYGDDSPESVEKAKAVMKCEVNTFSQYLNGEVYGYVIEDAEGNQLDSCWGFIGESPEDLATAALKGEI